MIRMCGSVYRDRRGRVTHTTPSVLLRQGLSEHVKRLIIQRVFLWSVSQPRLHLFIREDTRQFCEINNSAVVKGIRNDEPKLYHFLNSCIIDESKKSLWYHFQRRFRSMTQKTIWIVWKGMWVAVNMCTVWSLCMANRICDKFWWDFFFFFFFAVCPRNVNLSLPSHPESGLYGFPCIHWFLFLKYLSSGWGGVRAVPQGSDPPVGGEKDCAEIARRRAAFILRPKSMKCTIRFTFSRRNERVASGRHSQGVQKILHTKVTQGTVH